MTARDDMDLEDVHEVNDALLRAWPLPAAPTHADKEVRGTVLVIGGSRELPGAVLLAGTAALRAGAGKLMMATAASVAPGLALAVPESRVIALAESQGGGLLPEGAAQLAPLAGKLDAVLVGPGMMDEPTSCAFVRALLPLLPGVPVILDALALKTVTPGQRFDQAVLLTPHAGEMAGMCGQSKEAVLAGPARLARAMARDWNAVVALKGATSYIALPDGALWRHAGDEPGLATSGSGDVLAGIAAGLAARGAPLEQACAWAMALHARRPAAGPGGGAVGLPGARDCG